MRFEFKESPPTSKRSCYEIVAKGYWGDGDQDYVINKVVDYGEFIGLATVLTEVKEGSCDWSHTECYDYLVRTWGTTIADVTDIPSDDGCMVVSSIDSLELYYYDASGKRFAAELVE